MAAKFDGRKGSPRAWLFGIAHNVVRTHLRSERRWVELIRRGHAEPWSPNWEPESDARLDAQRMDHVLAEALAKLSVAQRDVLLLHAWGDLSPSEIAIALNLRPGTTRSRLSKARSIVREHIAGYAQVHGDESVPATKRNE